MPFFTQAVAGATYVLRRDVDAILLAPSDGGARRVSGVRTAAGQVLRCGALVAGAAYWDALAAPDAASRRRRRCVHRAAAVLEAPLCIVSGAASDASGAPLAQMMGVLPPGSLPDGGPPAPVRLLQYGPSACVTPDGRYLLHLSTPAVGDADADSEAGDVGSGDDCAARRALWPALQLVADVRDVAGCDAGGAGQGGEAPQPRLRWAVFYSQVLDEVYYGDAVLLYKRSAHPLINRRACALAQTAEEASSWLPANGALCVGPGAEADVCTSVRAAEAAFARLFPGVPFFAPPEGAADAAAKHDDDSDNDADAALLASALAANAANESTPEA